MTNQDHMVSILDDVLVLLSGQGFPTPERTYKLDGGWGLALSDLRRCFDQHRARIAELEAERDAARAGEARAVEALDVFARAYRVSMLPFAPGIDEADGAYHWMPHGWPSVGDFKLADSVLSGSSALSWLAHREREAAVRELEGLMESEWKWGEFELKASIYARIAALTKQQPTACSRSEVRGKGVAK